MRPNLRWQTGLVGIVLMAGCSNGFKANQSVHGISQEEAAELNSQHSRFEHGDDAAFTAQTHYAAGQLAESQGALPMALQHYQAALKIEPRNLPCLYQLAVVATKVKAYPDAIAAWQRYVDETKDATSYSNLGFCYELAGQSASAEAAYQQGISHDPRNQPCRINYGLMLARAGKATEATQQLAAVLPEAQVHYNLGSVYEQQSKRELAKAEYRKALELDPRLSEAQARMTALD
jgi:tetratricopeptide (TPR) repeat protein